LFFIDPVDKTTIIDKKGKIEKCLIKHFGDIGRDSTHQNEAHTNYVKTFISQAQNDKIPTKNMFSLNIQADIVQRALVSLKSGKAVFILEESHNSIFHNACINFVHV
jgi:hypothetical protein